MTNQSHQTNGASLEDCHTNFFALTELYGIKWRKLIWGESTEDGTAPLADPVISSYARCLAGDILCVWRRVPATQADPYEAAVPPPLSLRAAKELWIFWYGEEPDLNGLVAPELIASQGEQGSWDSGLSYECRSLLFKALHNLIERCLLSRDFVRLGKWFVQPYDGDEDDVGKSPWHLSFSFAFFLHGESTVCASVDVRQHPAVRTLTKRRLSALADHAAAPHKVILAPFGLEGTVTGREWSDADPATARLLDSWRQLYPLEQGCSALEVICGGVRMRYPSPYVLETDDDILPSPSRPTPALAGTALTHLATNQQSLETVNGDSINDKFEDFVDPTRKTPCTCAKWRRRRARPARAPPFHRRHHTSGAGCSPLSLGGGSPAPPSAPSSARAVSASPNHPAVSAQVVLGGAVPPLSLSTPAPTPDPHTPAPRNTDLKYNQSESPSNPASTNPAERVSRPVLPPPPRRTHSLDDEHELHMLYDYTTVHAWLEHPVKRFKTEYTQFEEQMALGENDANDLYQGHHHTKMAATPLRAPTHLNEKQEEDSKEYKSLFTSDGLCATLKDLDQIFDNSDEASGDETSLVAGLPLEGRWEPGRRPRMEELSKMFPTPPSMEPSPGTVSDDPHLVHDEPAVDTIEDWSYVFKPPQVCKYVGSSKYAPLTTLPSQLLPPVTLPTTAVYRPRWQHDKPQHNTHTERNRENGRVSTSSTTVAVTTTTTAVARSPSPPLSPVSAACPLTLNVLLADTLLNLFRDHNFDSCTLCVCHPSGTTIVGNIRGADAALYLHGAGAGSGWSVSEEEEPARCQCGFSAVVNRRRAYRAGLFYEDELEITGLPYNVGAGSQGRLGGVAAAAAVAACCVPGGPVCSLSRHPAVAVAATNQRNEPQIHLLEYADGGWCGWLGLRAAGGSPSLPPSSPASPTSPSSTSPSAVHRWPFLRAPGPSSSRDVVRLMRRLRPLLQDAIQKRCCGARMWDGVSGPLTWRQFHRLAGRGNEDLCEPQPVPPLLVGHDRDWLSLSPYALKHWDQLALEPYSYSRDLAYIVIAPDSELLAEPLKIFFRELTTAYEAARLGRHQSINRIAKEGIVRTAPSERDSENDEWTGELPPGRLGEYIKSYADVLKSLVNQLSSLTIDESIFSAESNRSHIDRPAPSPMRPPSTPDHPPTPSSQSDQEDANTTNNSTSNTHNSNVHLGTVSSNQYWSSERGAAGLVVYLVEPPGGPAALAPLLRLAAVVTQRLAHHAPLVKIISVEGVMEWCGVGGAGCGAGSGALRAGLRALAFSVFTGSRRSLRHEPDGKSLTGFGTAANAALFLNAKDEKNRAPYRLYCPAWVLAGSRGGGGGGGGRGGLGDGGGAECGVLFLAYCLSHDQRWLLAAVTDARGELLDTAVINIHVSHRSRRRRAAPARRLGLTKLMDFTLGVMSQSAQPWRLVVGRVGRIGHGELKGWSWLLSRKNLSRASNVLRDICGSCSMFYSSGVPKDFGLVTVPCILSACLVSTEPEPCLRLMADRFTPDERFSQASIQSHLHTPRDVTATHILVFPTSATTQSNQMPYEPPMANGEDSDMLLFEMPEEDIGDMGEDNMTDLLMGEMLTMFAPNSPRRHDDDPTGSRDGSPARQPSHGHNNFNGGNDDGDAVGSVLQQPLALGYLVSTAPLADMPDWWWAGAGHLTDVCPAFVRSALHLHAGTLQAPDDLTFGHQRPHTHPLDSQITTDVLRYVLESYNALSWLALDDKTHDRQSCLPLHVQVLMQLYHTAAALS